MATDPSVSSREPVHVVMKSIPFFLLFVLAAGPAMAQVQRAQPADQVSLGADPGNDYFLRGKNLHDSAKASTDYENKVALYQRAADILSDYLTNYPNHPNAEMAWWYLGNSYYQSGNIEGAKDCFRTLVNKYRRGKWAAAAAYTLAAADYNNGRFAEAAPMFQRYAENGASPGDRARGYYYLGKCYQMLGRNREATAAYSNAMADPQGGVFITRAKLGIARIALDDKKYAEAMPIYEGILAETNSAKDKGEAALNASICAVQLDQPEKADQYLVLIMRTPGMEEFRPQAQTTLMANLFKKKEFAEVIRVFRSSNIKGEGADEAARLMLAARSYMRLKEPASAIDLFREVEKLSKPQDDIAFQASYNRLLCFFQIKGRHVPDQVDGFLQLYRKSRANDPRIHTALMMKAESLEAADKPEQAAKVYNEVDAGLISEKNRPGLYYKRGWLLAETGDHQGAIRSLSEFISQYPEDARVPVARAKRAKAYAAVDDSDRAIIDFDSLIRPGSSENLISYAWLESARLRRSDARHNYGDMVQRYKGLLACGVPLSQKIKAEANYFIGQGLVKDNKSADAIPFLESARKLQPETYGPNAGALLALAHYAGQNQADLSKEIILSIRGGYAQDIASQAIHWSAIQAFNAGDYRNAAAFLTVISTPDNPRATSREIWRYLAKSRLETGNPEGALDAVAHVLDTEKDAAWKADALYDKGRALYQLKRYKQSRETATASLDMQPQGRTKIGLLILAGDLALKAGNNDEAAANYLQIVQFHQDKEFLPLALSKLADLSRSTGKADDAEQYSKQLSTQFPDWKKP